MYEVDGVYMRRRIQASSPEIPAPHCLLFFCVLRSKRIKLGAKAFQTAGANCGLICRGRVSKAFLPPPATRLACGLGPPRPTAIIPVVIREPQSSSLPNSIARFHLTTVGRPFDLPYDIGSSPSPQCPDGQTRLKVAFRLLDQRAALAPTDCGAPAQSPRSRQHFSR